MIERPILMATFLSCLSCGWAVAQNSPPSDNTYRKEAVCQTTPAEGQAGMSNADCAFIASQIPVLPSKTNPQTRSDTDVVPSARYKPGADIPSSIQQLKPLPNAVTQRFPALKEDQYFLSGQDIVIVTKGAKVAFVIRVNVLPQPIPRG
jgi:hypothetical protein